MGEIDLPIRNVHEVHRETLVQKYLRLMIKYLWRFFKPNWLNLVSKTKWKQIITWYLISTSCNVTTDLDTIGYKTYILSGLPPTIAEMRHAFFGYCTGSLEFDLSCYAVVDHEQCTPGDVNSRND